MSTKKTKRGQTAGAAVAEVERTASPFDGRDVIHINVDEIAESPFNARRIVDAGALVPVIMQQGVLSPILVREVDRSTIERQDLKAWELVAGHRRLAAVRSIGWETIPAINLGTISDAASRAAQAIENLQRKDLNPIEEADAFEAMRADDVSIEEIAARAGRSTTYVRQRMYLRERLPVKVAEAVAAGTFPVVAALELARVENAKAREKVAKDILDRNAASDPVTAREVFDAIRNEVLDLTEAPFATADPHLVPEAGSCIACPKRSGNTKDLFGSVIDNGDVCMDKACYATKVKASFEANAARASEQGIKTIGPGLVASIFTQYDTASRHKTLRGVDEQVDRYDYTGKGETWRDVMKRIQDAGGEVPAMSIVQRPRDGAAVLLVDAVDLKAAAKKARVAFGKAKTRAEAKKKGPSPAEAKRKEEDAVKRETERVVRQRVLDAAKDVLSLGQMRAIAEIFLRAAQQQRKLDLANLVIGKGAVEKKGAELYAAGAEAERLLLKLVRDGLGASSVQVLAGLATFEADLMFDDKAVRLIRDAFGVDVAEVRREVVANRKTQAATSGKADKGKVGRKASGPAEGKSARRGGGSTKRAAGPLARKKKR